MMDWRILIRASLIFGSLAFSAAEVQVPRILDVAPVILPAEISEGIQWSGADGQDNAGIPVILPADISDGIQWSDADVHDKADIPVILPADISDGIRWSDDAIDEDETVPLLQDDYNQYDDKHPMPNRPNYDYGPLSVRSDEYYEELAQFMRQLDYYEELDYESNLTSEEREQQAEAIDRMLDKILYPQEVKEVNDNVDEIKDDISPNLNTGDIPVADLADFYQTFESKEKQVDYDYNQIVGAMDKIIYDDITDMDGEYVGGHSGGPQDNSQEADESSEENGSDSDEDRMSDVKILYQDLFGSNDKTVHYTNIGKDMRFLELACYVGIFLGFMLLTFGSFICCIRLLRVRGSESSRNIEPTDQIKNVKLSGIVKSYARIPVEIRNMKPSNVAYKELYNVV